MSLWMIRCGVGQQSQDGGETVQFLLDVLGQLLVLLVPADQTSVNRNRRAQEPKK